MPAERIAGMSFKPNPVVDGYVLREPPFDAYEKGHAHAVDVLAARRSTAVAVGASAALFGLWHVLPALGLESVNPVAEDTVGQLPGWVTVLASVASTSLVGVWFWWLRDRSGSLLAPMALHWATNAFGYLFAYAVWNS